MAFVVLILSVMDRDTEKVFKVRALRFPSILSWEEEEDLAKETERMKSEAAETQERVVSKLLESLADWRFRSEYRLLGSLSQVHPSDQLLYILRREGMKGGAWARRVTPKPREWRGSHSSLYLSLLRIQAVAQLSSTP